MDKEVNHLHQLAESQGLQTSYQDVYDRVQQASPESLLAVLRAQDLPIQRADQARDLHRQVRLERARRMLEPVTACWHGDAPGFLLRLPRSVATGSVTWNLTSEDGDLDRGTSDLQLCKPRAEQSVEGEVFVEFRIPLPSELRIGYHELDVQIATEQASSLIVMAPRRAYSPTDAPPRSWGAFLPLYALHSQHSWGAGDFADLQSLNTWIADSGGTFVATLPLLASFFGSPADESPYRPASRLFWNEFYLDLAGIPELSTSAAARRLLQSADHQMERDRLRGLANVEYQDQMELKRQVLQIGAEELFGRGASDRYRLLQEFLRANPEVEGYARFRAVQGKFPGSWASWPQAMRNGRLSDAETECDESLRRYHLYVQWLVHEQLSEVSRAAREAQLTWYLDLPVGVHPDGYDAWRFQTEMALSASGGAPPDTFFTKGQCWEFPVLHPFRQREQRYGYFRRVIRNHLQFAKLLRIDHVMGLHRLFWVPQGMDAEAGVYVRYPADEIYSILTLESQRHQARLIGENLGTVPPEVDAAMDKHNIGRLYVLQYEANPDREPVLPNAKTNQVAGLNTHDMPPFAAFWSGQDIDDRVNLKLRSEAAARQEHIERKRLREKMTTLLRQRGLLAGDQPDARDVMQACQLFLADSDAEVVLINLEDTWLEAASQNTPGTVIERVNWRRKASRSLEEMQQDAELRSLFRQIHALRQRAAND